MLKRTNPNVAIALFGFDLARYIAYLAGRQLVLSVKERRAW